MPWYGATRLGQHYSSPEEPGRHGSTRVRLDIETWITQEQFDIGASILPIDNPAVEVEPFLKTRAVVVMSNAHPLARRKNIKLADLLDVALVATHSRSLSRQHLERLFSGKQ
jgi:DNA-binding transcriptional LysR family regulator